MTPKVREQQKTQGHTRSSRWPSIRKLFLLENPVCTVCAGKTKLQVHHKKPFHLDPTLELDKNNLITLCEAVGRDCHLNIGHLQSFKSYNPTVAEDAKTWSDKIRNRPV